MLKMVKIIHGIKQTYHVSTINVAIRETGRSELCDHASTVAMIPNIP